MNVINRLALLVDEEPVAHWYPRFRTRFHSVVLLRIREASAALSLKHLYRRTSTSMVKSLRAVIPEMEWFRRTPGLEIHPAGKENRITWGRS